MARRYVRNRRNRLAGRVELVQETPMIADLALNIAKIYAALAFVGLACVLCACLTKLWK